ncbi:hypothetical protein ACKTEK_11700 [Tepidamorphus sp. 3E244]|uniref:hypothetical protein n=1 Tax=Tepidamorphus sp. 3E244 TaxID=3385498 RepID=UPI0038FCD74A
MSDISSSSHELPVTGAMYETPPHLIDGQAEDAARLPALGCGFKKVTLDSAIHDRLMDHFRANVHNFTSEGEGMYIRTENPRAYPSLLFQHEEFNQRLMSDVQDVHEAWCGKALRKAACYGIRVYQPRSYLLNHYDHSATHVVSSTICVDSRLNRPWPLYIEDLDGNPHEVSIEPGEMVFFEGAKLKHGRPYAMDGEYYANIFVHFTPVDWPGRG